MQQNPLLEVDALTAKSWLDNQEAVLIDVREPSEYEEVRIAQATLIPLGGITADQLPIIKTGQKIIVHCARGVRSAKAIEKIKLEHPELPLYNLVGGITEWIRLNLPTLKGK